MFFTTNQINALRSALDDIQAALELHAAAADRDRVAIEQLHPLLLTKIALYKGSVATFEQQTKSLASAAMAPWVPSEEDRQRVIAHAPFPLRGVLATVGTVAITDPRESPQSLQKVARILTLILDVQSALAA